MQFRDAVEVTSAILKQNKGIIGVTLSKLVGDLMQGSYVVEELYEDLRLPGALCAAMVNKMFGIDHYIKICIGRDEFFIRVDAESRAF